MITSIKLLEQTADDQQITDSASTQAMAASGQLPGNNTFLPNAFHSFNEDFLQMIAWPISLTNDVRGSPK